MVCACMHPFKLPAFTSAASKANDCTIREAAGVLSLIPGVKARSPLPPPSMLRTLQSWPMTTVEVANFK